MFFHTEADGNDSFTKLLLHFDDANNSTTLKDYSPSGQSPSCNGSAKVSTTQAKFGSTAASLGTFGNYISVPDSADWFFDTGNFTIDLWCYFNTLPGAGVQIPIVWQSTDNNNIWFFGTDNAAVNLGFVVLSGGSTVARYTAATGFSTGAWTHLAVVRSGTSIFMFKNGVAYSLTVGTAIGSASIPNFAGTLNVGPRDSGNTFDGFVDEVRVSKGIARWTANFTPPVTSYG